ncbi:hypothetical protein ACSBR2_003597 [Camellia fascicularis]
MVNKLTDLQTVVNFMMQNNVMQLAFPLQDTPTTAAKAGVQKGEQKAVPTVLQYAKGQENSHRQSRDAGRTKSTRGESQRIP